MRTLARIFSAGLMTLTVPPAFANDAINYQDHIRPIFQQSCFNCHNPDRARGGLDLTSYRATVAGGSSGEIVTSQSHGDSSLFGVMNHTLEPKMPPNGDKVADDKLALVKLWIDQGLRETADSAINKPKKPRVDLSVGQAAVGRPVGPPIMPTNMPLGPIHHTPRPGAIADVAGHPWSPIVATTGQRQVLIHHTDTGELLGVLPFAYGQPQTLRFAWSGKLLLVGGGVGGSSGTAVLYDVHTGQEVARVGDEVDQVLAADLDPTQRFVALGGPSKRVKGFDLATGELRYNLDKHTEWVTAIAFSPDGDYLASGDRNGGLHIWEADSGLHVYRLDGHSDSVTELSWRYDGKVLASSGEDGQAKLWEMKNGRQVKSWNAHSGGAMSIAYSEDGRLVTTGRDQLVRVWDASGSKQHETKPLDAIGLAAAFDTTAQAVVAGDLSGKLVRWSLNAKAQQVDTWTSNPPPIEVALSDAQRRVAEQQAALDRARASAKQKQDEPQRSAESVAAAERSLAQAKRQSAKWQSAQLRLQIDALRRERDALRGQRQALVAKRDRQLAEVDRLEQQLTGATREMASHKAKLDKQPPKIARAKQRVASAKEHLDPDKPESVWAVEDAEFDVETEVYTLAKLSETLSAMTETLPTLQTAIEQARQELRRREQALAKQPQDPGAARQAELDAMLSRYEALRKAAGFKVPAAP